MFVYIDRKDDVGKPKAEVAAAFVNARVPGVNVTPYFGKIQVCLLMASSFLFNGCRRIKTKSIIRNSKSSSLV